MAPGILDAHKGVNYYERNRITQDVSYGTSPLTGTDQCWLAIE